MEEKWMSKWRVSRWKETWSGETGGDCNACERVYAYTMTNRKEENAGLNNKG